MRRVVAANTDSTLLSSSAELGNLRGSQHAWWGHKGQWETRVKQSSVGGLPVLREWQR